MAALKPRAHNGLESSRKVMDIARIAYEFRSKVGFWIQDCECRAGGRRDGLVPCGRYGHANLLKPLASATTAPNRICDELWPTKSI